jgi:enoyl-CoA hydratase
MNDAQEPALRRERRGSLEVLTINRPGSGNSLDAAVLGGLAQAFAEADDDPDLRVLIVTGTGERIFCGGMDLRAFASGEMEGLELGGYQRFLDGQLATPVIAAVNGAAVAGGFELMLGCDLAVVADHARFGVPEVKRGLFAPTATSKLPGRIPLTIAFELCLTGELIGAERARELGLVNRVVAGDRVLEEAIALADAIGANGPLAVAASKQVIREAATHGELRARALAHELQPAVFGSEDAREGASAFVEKRAAVWKGR